MNEPPQQLARIMGTEKGTEDGEEREGGVPLLPCLLCSPVAEKLG